MTRPLNENGRFYLGLSMTNEERELLLSSIIAGESIIFIDDNYFYVKSLSKQDRYLSEVIYKKYYDDSLSDGSFSEDELFDFMIIHNFWNFDHEEQLNGLSKDIETMQVGLYENRHNDDLLLNTKKLLRQAKDKQVSLFRKRHEYDYLSAQGVANTAKYRFIATASLHDNVGKKLYSWDSYTDDNFNILLNKMGDSRISPDQLRELARTEPWKTIWNIGKPNPFGIPTVDLSQEQISLLSLSSMYDTLRDPNNSERPEDAILNDDDLLDGWLIIRRRKHTETINKNNIESRISDSVRGCSEVFVMAQSREDIKRIEDANDPYSKHIKMQRFAALKQMGEIREEKMPDTRRNLQMQINSLKAQR